MFSNWYARDRRSFKTNHRGAVAALVQPWSRDCALTGRVWSLNPHHSAVKVGHKRIFLFTNEDDPNAANKNLREQSFQRAKVPPRSIYITRQSIAPSDIYLYIPLHAPIIICSPYGLARYAPVLGPYGARHRHRALLDEQARRKL
jgi:hypothetical protein